MSEQPKNDDTALFAVRPLPIFIGFALFALLVALPEPEGLSRAGWHVIAVGALMVVWWITEAIPVPVTALLPIALFPILGVVSTREAAAPYSDPIIFLFLGGFVLAIAMERWNLHRRIALGILARTGSQQSRIVGGFMLATAFCGLWVSNTATVVMMLPVALSVVKLVQRSDRSDFPIALLLGVAYAASIGGVATLIGTPPNALLAGMLNRNYGYDIGFARWMVFGVPIACTMLFFSWVLLTKLTLRLDKGEVPGASDLFRAEKAKLGPWENAEIRVAIVFALTAFAWMTRTIVDDYVPGLSDASIGVIAMIALFLIPAGDGRRGALIEWRDALRIPWGVLILFGGGLSLAAAVMSTGLDQWIGGKFALAGTLPLFWIVVCVSLGILILTEFMSNTATAATFVPLVAALAISLGENPLMLAVPATLAASMTFMLPVATPPNALVYSSGEVTVKQMATQGFWHNIVALIVLSVLSYVLLIAFFDVTVGVLPDWATGRAQ